MTHRHLSILALAGLTALSACADDTAPTEAVDPSQTFTPSSDSEDGEAYEPLDTWGKGDDFANLGGAIEFAAACEPGDTLTIAAVGDVLLHGRLQQQAFREPDGYVSLWRGVADLLAQADVTYANLEGPTAPGVISSGRAVDDPGRRFDDYVYTSYPMFNYHHSLLDDLMASGVDVVSTSNNHSLDRRSLGADRTIEQLEARGLPYTGTRPADSDREAWWTTTDEGGFRLAWLGCTYGTNGIPDNDDQVLHCFQDDELIEASVRGLADRSDIDAVILTPHWGQEYQATPQRQQLDWAHRMLDAGALAIIGAHPHVTQPWERYVTADGRETFAIYSLGNFVSGQRHLPRRSTLILYLGLTRTDDGVKLNGARYVPAHMTQKADGSLTLEAPDRTGRDQDSRQLTTDMFGLYNLQPPDDALVTNPQCNPEWIPPHPHDGWIGGSCEGPMAEQACGEASCDEELPGGLCTQACTSTCPDKVGRPTTFCVDLGDGAGSCVLQCTVSADCRPGYSCQERTRISDDSVIRKVCVPTE